MLQKCVAAPRLSSDVSEIKVAFPIPPKRPSPLMARSPPPMTLGNAARERQSEDGFAGESAV